MIPTTRSRRCGLCGCHTEHDTRTGIIVTQYPLFNLDCEAPCKVCGDWLAGREPFKAKRPGES